MTRSTTSVALGLATHHRRRIGLVALLTLSAAMAIDGGASTLAQFTDTGDATASFSTGTISLTVAPATVFSVANAFPGDSGSQTVTVTNDGTGEMRYAMTTAATDPDALGGQIEMTVKVGACPSSGSTAYAGKVDVAAFGSPAQGAQAGDRVLAAAASEQLCFAWSLPLATTNAFQGRSASMTFTFAAEQTANNP